MTSLFIKYILPVLTALGALGLAILAAISVGKSKQKTKDEKKATDATLKKVEAAAAKQIETIKGANDVKNDVNKLGPDNAAEQLRDKWQRD